MDQSTSLRQVYNEAIENIDLALSRCENAQNIARIATRSYESMLEQIVEAGEQRKNQGNGDLPPSLVKVLYIIARIGYLRCALYHIDHYQPSEKLTQDLWGSSETNLREQYNSVQTLLPMLFHVDETMENQE